MTRQSRLFGLPILILLLALCNVAARSPQEPPPITYERYDAEVTLRQDGTFVVREIQQLRFDGEFHTAFAEIPTTLTSEIKNIQIYEGEAPYRLGRDSPQTFITENDGASVYVTWEYAPTQPGDIRTFVLEYEVVGGLWVYPDENILEWRVVPADRSDILVESSRVTVTLPSPVAAQQLRYTAYGPTSEATANATQVVFAATEPLPNGVQFQIQVGFPSDLVTTTRQPWQVQEDSARLDYRFPSLAVELTLEPDGTLWADEYHHLAVEAGALDQGYRRIPLHLLDKIDNIQLFEGEQEFTKATAGCDYCLQLIQIPRDPNWVYYDPDLRMVVTNEDRGGSVQLNWQFPPLVRGEETTLRLRYRVVGAMRLLGDRQELNWTAVFPDRNVTVESATVRLHLPADIAAEAVKINGGAVEWADGVAQIKAPGDFPPARPWEIQVTLPATATHAAPAQWQQAMEQALLAASQEETRLARLQLGFGVAAILALALGLLGVYLIWYLWGRDLPTPTVADYLIEPPSNLPPAIVAYLIDEQPSVKGALASLFELANWGLLWIRPDEGLALKRVYPQNLAAGATVTTPSGEKAKLPEHLITLFNALHPALPFQEETPLYRVNSRFQSVLPLVYAQMGKEANRFFDELPAQARHRWLVRGQWLVLLGILVAILLAFLYYSTIGWIAVAPALAATLAGIALVIASRWMPRRTAVGVEETQRWLAFRNYLRNLKQYGTLEQAQRIMDRYFAYAVALDVEEVVLEQAAAMGSAMPDWSYLPGWESVGHPNQRREQRPIGQPAEGQTGTPSSLPPLQTNPSAGEKAPPTTAPRASPRQRPSLSGMSRQLGGALSTASSNLGTLLSRATGDAPQSTPFQAIWEGTQAAGKVGGAVASTTFDILGEILESSSSGGGSGGYSSSGSSRSSWSSSSSRSSSSGGGFSSGHSSSSRRSGGGGKRGFG